jgi:two-component system CheB/CheR fusion protein
MPYRTFDEKMDGVVITFFNISDLKEVQVKLHETEQINRLLMNTSSDVIIRLSNDYKIMELNQAAEKYLGVKQEKLTNKNYITTFIPEWFRNKIEIELNQILSGSHDTRLKMQVITEGEKIIEKDWSVILLLDNFNKPCGMLLSLIK